MGIHAPSALAYRTVRGNICELALDSPGVAGKPVPACPEWTVRDLVAHLAGNCAGMLGAPAPDGAGLADQVTAWSAAARQVESLAQAGGMNIARLLMDAFTHELDLREALGLEPPADHPAYPIAFDVVAGGLAWSITARGLPALRLATNGMSWDAGPGRPAATVTAPRHDLYRCLTGRRTPAEIAALDWSADPAQWLPAFFWGPFSPPRKRS